MEKKNAKETVEIVPPDFDYYFVFLMRFFGASQDVLTFAAQLSPAQFFSVIKNAMKITAEEDAVALGVPRSKVGSATERPSFSPEQLRAAMNAA